MRTDHTFLEEMRQVGDVEADHLVARIVDQKQEKDLYGYLNLSLGQVENHRRLPQIHDFLLQSVRIPSWSDPDRLVRGQRFFRKYALDIMTLLGALSLPYCYAASPGNKAIYLTEKMRKSPGKRLLETAQFIISVMEENSFTSGKAVFEIQKTRLIHAMVRHFIMARTPWDMHWGLPVNQEDMAGTNLAFSYIIVRGLEKSDFNMTEQDKEDFLYAWRFIGYQLHIDEALLPASLEEGKHLEQVIKQRHFRLSEEGRMLTKELLQHYRESFPAIAGYFVESQIRYLTGPEVSALLGLESHPVKDSIIRTINQLRKKLNRLFNNPFSYEIMIRNHLKLKEKYKV